MQKRKLTDDELKEWANNLSGGENWADLAVDQIYEMMIDTAGSEYDSGEADWGFGYSDAERMLKEEKEWIK